MKTLMKKFQKKMQGLQLQSKVAKDTPKQQAQAAKAKDAGYFTRASGWADDIYTVTVASRNRYKMAFFAAMGLSAMLTFAVMVLAPMQQVELEIVHQGPSGNAWVSLTKTNQTFTQSWARSQSEIAHYVRTRESYDPILYANQTKEVALLSSQAVYAQYELSQSSTNSSAGINALGAKGYRTIIINNVMQLDSTSKNINGRGNHVNLAQVNFVMVDHLFGQSRTIKIPYMALVSWTYNGVPKTPDKLLRDWDGFSITKYTVQPINVGTPQQS